MPKTESQKKAINEYNTKRRKERLSNGLCIDCGEKTDLSKNTGRHYQRCRKHRIRHTRYYNKKGDEHVNLIIAIVGIGNSVLFIPCPASGNEVQIEDTK